jgi:hypothetical protein
MTTDVLTAATAERGLVKGANVPRWYEQASASEIRERA